MVKGKTQEDWVDYVDDKLRMCLAHLRGLKTSEISRQRIFKKTDSNQQMQIEELLSMIHLPPDLRGCSGREVVGRRGDDG